jgi:flagella synthesis protein FlgN
VNTPAVPRVSPPDPRARFVADLHAEAAAFADFFELLRTEQAALAERDIDALLQIGPSKAERIAALNDLARRRTAYLTGQSFSPDRDGMARWLLGQGGSDAGALSAAWQRLLDTAARAQALNRENGVLIETRLQHNQQLLSALASGAQPSLYGPDGQTRMGGTGRNLGKV